MPFPQLAVLAALLAAVPGRAAAQEADATFRDVRFASGEVLPEVRIHYRTMGRLQRNAAGTASNAVLLLHSTGGSIAQYLGPGYAGRLFGAGQPLDTARYYLVIPDNIGHGRSSKPSDGLHARFPHYGYGDMVALQERLLRETLGVTHLRLVMGASMGCMHTWVWVTTRPQWMDQAAAFACQPTQISGRNRMIRRFAMDAITDDPEYKGGDYGAQPRGLRAAYGMLWMMGTAPAVQQQAAPTRDRADSLMRLMTANALRTLDANDFLYQFDASSDYDPEPLLGRVRAPILFVNSADDEVNPPELHLADTRCAMVPSCRFVLLPIGPNTRGHGTHTNAVAWEATLAEFLAQLR